MATPSEKLAEALEALRALQVEGKIAIRSNQLQRTHRERLLKGGFLKEVMKGWYIPSRPDETKGESTSWYASFWHFAAEYLTERFDKDWCLSPEQSIKLHVGNRTVPQQLYVRSPSARNQITSLPYGTAILEVRAYMPDKAGVIINGDGLRLFSLPSALINVHQDFFEKNVTVARTALAMFSDASEILAQLLEGGHTVIAGRLAGAFRNIGRPRIAENIVSSMKAADFAVRETDPFETKSPIIILQRERSPYVNRMKIMWHTMREEVLTLFPKAPGLPKNIDAYLKQVEGNYTKDAYNSLSIEGYRVSVELIEKVKSGNWNPGMNDHDRNQRDAMAARGYWQAFQAVQESLKKILSGGNAGEIVDHDHVTWYRELFAPSVTAGLLKASDLAGYRNHPVYIRRSMHTPPSQEAMRDLMPVFFELLAEEKEAAVRVVLGHFVFVYIHPYMDGNGRMGRFLMNTMLASGGYPWTVVPLEKKDAYMNSLEQASAQENIKPFAEFIAELVGKAND